MITKEDFRTYCEAWNLVFKDHDTLVKESGDEEEWEGVLCAGFYPSKSQPVFAACLSDDNVVSALSRWDGPSGDEITEVKESDFWDHSRRLHAE